MLPHLIKSWLSIAVVLVGLASSSCSTSPPVCAPGCAECRAIAVQETRARRSGRHFKDTSKAARVHNCSCCKVQVDLYEQDGKTMLRCPTCAPHGVDCEACAESVAHNEPQ